MQGKEVYKGDIVKYITWSNEFTPRESSNIKEVTFNAGVYAPIPFVMHCEDEFYSYGIKEYKIIGNIFETPGVI